jgi:hypothetical protein
MYTGNYYETLEGFRVAFKGIRWMLQEVNWQYRFYRITKKLCLVPWTVANGLQFTIRLLRHRSLGKFRSNIRSPSYRNLLSCL